MTENSEWKWWVGKDDEAYTTECATRDEAVYIAREEYEGAFIIEAKKPGNLYLSDYFDAERFLEDADERAYDDHGNPNGDFGPVFHATEGEQSDLQDMVCAAIDAWQEKHGLKFTGFKFAASRNGEYIAGPDEDDQ